jgi:hypothetical protein
LKILIQSRLLSSAATLFTLLTNPLNLSLLTSQILTAPAIWSISAPYSSNIRTPLRVLTAFHNAANHILHREVQPAPTTGLYLPAEGLHREEWVHAMVKGADDRSERWKHLLVLGGLLTGFESHDRQGLPSALREHLESAVVTATNLALQDSSLEPGLQEYTIVMVLSHCFDVLSYREKANLDIDKLTPLLTKVLFYSKEGLHWGYFLGTSDSDIIQDKSNKFTWEEKSVSFYQVQWMAAGPIVSGLGVLSRVAAYCVENLTDTNLVFQLVEDLTTFSRSLSTQWRQNKLSELDVSEETQFLAEQALQKTLPLLWQVLKSTMFSIVIIQNGVISRALRDRRLPIGQLPFIAVQSLHTLRNVFFIASRIGHRSFSQFNFVYTASIDMLARYPRQVEAFLQDIRPKEFGKISEHPYERCRDLYFLNTSENFTLDLPEDINEELLLGAALPYLGTGGDSRLNEIFEAAHSVYLAVFSAPQNYNITAKHLPFYIQTLFEVSSIVLPI